jgi:hypothetical protein
LLAAASAQRTLAAVLAVLSLAAACAGAASAGGPLAITTSSTTVSTRGFLSVRARCASSTPCRGTMTVRAFGRLVGRGSFVIRAHRAGTVVVLIDARARRALFRTHRTRATVTLVARYAAVARYVTIAAPAGGFSG